MKLNFVSVFSNFIWGTHLKEYYITLMKIVGAEHLGNIQCKLINQKLYGIKENLVYIF